MLVPAARHSLPASQESDCAVGKHRVTAVQLSWHLQIWNMLFPALALWPAASCASVEPGWLCTAPLVPTTNLLLAEGAYPHVFALKRMSL